jgi:1-deoxy-D-xylulose-5-phosphate reductoisomerase
LILLGSTGSIGVNTLLVAKKHNIKVEALVAGKNIELLNKQIKKFSPKYVVVQDKEDIEKVHHDRVFFSQEGILEVLNLSSSNLVVNSLVGFAGLKPTLEAIKLGKKLALANKESLVVGGEFIDTTNITPIDSEHFGLWYLLSDKKISSMTITASGGSFRETPLEKLKNATVKDALNHPNWSMGKKITIDSATMVNKLFELLEAKWLFNVQKLDAIIETKSIIHALINFQDGSSTAHIAGVDMKLPISYAILEKVEDEILKPIDLTEVGSLEFRKIDSKRYPIWSIKDEILKKPHLGVVINASNEVAIEQFFSGNISFLDISKTILKAFKEFENIKASSVEELFLIDKEVREFCNF